MPAPLRTTRPVVASTLAAVLLATLVLSACTSDAGSDVGSGGHTKLVPPVTTQLTAPSSTSSSTPPATATSTAAATTTLPAPVGAATPAVATAALYQAFQRGDRAAAAMVAEPAAIDAVFGAAPGPYALYSGCDTAEFDTSGCLYRDRSTNNTIQFDMTKRGNAWVVTGAFFSAG